FVFFFSSRRRHTRSKRDWSSDVCSSDLWYIIMLLLQCMAPSGYSRSPQAPKLWMQQISKCVPAKPLKLRCARCSMLLLQCLAARSEERRVGKECGCRRAGESERI